MQRFDRGIQIAMFLLQLRQLERVFVIVLVYHNHR